MMKKGQSLIIVSLIAFLVIVGGVVLLYSNKKGSITGEVIGDINGENCKGVTVPYEVQEEYTSDDKKKTVCFTRDNFDYVVSQRDMTQLIHKCIIASPKVKYGILAGISNNHNKYMDLKFTKKLVGYKPQDDVYKLCKSIREVKEKKKYLRFFPWRRKK